MVASPGFCPMVWKRFFLFCRLVMLLLVAGCTNTSSDQSAFISGTIQCDNYHRGKIYVLIMPSETSMNTMKQKIREMEAETFPYLSKKIVTYTVLDAPGNYLIAGLNPGNYVVWAWADVNMDGGVNHLNYAEPVGWYQTKSNLSPRTVSIDAQNSASGINIRLVSLRPYPDGDLSVVRGNGGGTLKSIRNQKVLHLWGTSEERGYAHGFLAGRQIVDWINYVLIEHYAPSTDFYENTFLPFVRVQCKGNTAYYGEIDAMLQGMRDSGIDMRLEWLNREVTRDDIIAQNNLYLIALYGLRKYWPLSSASLSQSAIACTSAVFWGNWTQNAELSGGIIHGKNNDGENDLRKITVNSLLIIATEPLADIPQKRVVGFDWPGFYGTCHGMNQSGLVMAPHSVTTMPNWDVDNFLDYSVFYMETLRQCSSIAEVKTFWESSTTTRTGGFNTAISTPYQAGQGYYPAAIYETDSFGGLLREPREIDPIDDPFVLLTVNNFFKYQGVNQRAVEITHGYASKVEPDNYRYQAMLTLMNQYRTQSRTVGTAEMIEILKATSNTAQYSGITEYSVICYPNSMTFALAKEDLEHKILSASFAEFKTFTFNEVFQ